MGRWQSGGEVEKAWSDILFDKELETIEREKARSKRLGKPMGMMHMHHIYPLRQNGMVAGMAARRADG